MQITIIASELLPFDQQTIHGQQVGEMARALCDLDHSVSVVVPLPAELDLSFHSLARRLMPIKVDVDGEMLKCVRYDGRTSDGVTVHLLEVESIPFKATNTEPHDRFSKAFCAATEAVIQAQVDPPDICITVDTGGWLNPRLIGAGVAADKPFPHLVVVSQLADGPNLEQRFATAHRVALTDRRLAARIRDEKISPVAEMLGDGRAAVVPLGAPLSEVPVDKASAKTAFQMRVGLPVRGDVPLVLFAEAESDSVLESLGGFLTGDVQVVVPAEPNNRLVELAERYPDRLTLVPLVKNGDWMPLLWPMDGCLLDGRAVRCSTVLACGVVPLAAAGSEGEVVDLEPSLESGSGIVVRDHSAPELKAGLRRLISAFNSAQAFTRLRSRLPEYTMVWPRSGRQYLQLMEEI